MGWWEEVIYAFAGLVRDPAPLLEGLAEAMRGGSATHALITARCLEALPFQERRLPAELRAELLDALVLRMREDREPSPERRAQFVTALGRLNHHQVRHELRRILVEKVRITSSGPRFEYTNVRIAAARALRDIYFAAMPKPDSVSKTDTSLVLSSYMDQISGAGEPLNAAARMPSIAEIRDEQVLARLMRIWQKGAAGRDELVDLLRNSPFPPERSICAFAIADLADWKGRKLMDARQLLRVIASPTDTPGRELVEDWEDTMWAAADALTLFDPELVVPLLRVIISRARYLPDTAVQQLAYLAGRLQASDKIVVDWLIGLLITNPSQAVKAMALRSLATMGQGIPSIQLYLPSGRPGPTLKRLIQDIAAAHPIPKLQLGAFEVRLTRSDTSSALYLQRVSIEALAWVGDAETLRDIKGIVAAWPLELREVWYTTAHQIRRRLQGK